MILAVFAVLIECTSSIDSNTDMIHIEYYINGSYLSENSVSITNSYFENIKYNPSVEISGTNDENLIKLLISHTSFVRNNNYQNSGGSILCNRCNSNQSYLCTYNCSASEGIHCFTTLGYHSINQTSISSCSGISGPIFILQGSTSMKDTNMSQCSLVNYGCYKQYKSEGTVSFTFFANNIGRSLFFHDDVDYALLDDCNVILNQVLSDEQALVYAYKSSVTLNSCYFDMNTATYYLATSEASITCSKCSRWFNSWEINGENINQINSQTSKTQIVARYIPTHCSQIIPRTKIITPDATQNLIPTDIQKPTNFPDATKSNEYIAPEIVIGDRQYCERMCNLGRLNSFNARLYIRAL